MTLLLPSHCRCYTFMSQVNIVSKRGHKPATNPNAAERTNRNRSFQSDLYILYMKEHFHLTKITKEEKEAFSSQTSKPAIILKYFQRAGDFEVVFCIQGSSLHSCEPHVARLSMPCLVIHFSFLVPDLCGDKSNTSDFFFVGCFSDHNL